VRTCEHCHKEKSEEEFHSKGPGRARDAWCRICRAAKDRDDYAAAFSPEQLARLRALRAIRELPPVEKAKRQQQWSRELQEVRRKRLADFKRGRLCLDCGWPFHPQALDFDHRDEKKFSISAANSRHPWEVLLAEMEKCDLVCASCHRVRTARRREGLPATLPPPEYEI
jgi:5-methylcytosine-specific restriction endonuclease McrA